MAEPDFEDHIKSLYAYAEKEAKAFRPKEQFIRTIQLSWGCFSPVP
jgi:hypothetical protein